MKKIGELIATIRNEKGFKQEQLAERMGIDRSVLSKWERDVNNIPYYQLALIAEVLETPIIFSERGIFAGKEAIHMSQIYSTSFTNFNSEALKRNFKDQLQSFQTSLIRKTEQAIQTLTEQGYEVQIPHDLQSNLAFSGANQQEVDEEITIFLPEPFDGQPSLKIINTGSLYIKYFDGFQLIHDLTEIHGEEVGRAIEKGLLYGCTKEDLGFRLFNWAEHSGSAEELIHLCPYVQDYAELIATQCLAQNYIKALEEMDHLFARTEDWQWIWNLNLYDLYQDHEWRVFWDMDGEERLVEDMDTCHYLGQALECIESIVETDYDDLLEELELNDLEESL